MRSHVQLRKVPNEIHTLVSPFKDVEGFDSLSGIEATVLLSETLGQDLPDSVFTPEEGNRMLSINEVADTVLGCTSAAKVTG